MAWMCSTVIGIMLFLMELAVIVWMQFYNISITAAVVATGVLLPILILFIGVIFKFYQQIVSSKMSSLNDLLEQSKHLEIDAIGNRQKVAHQAINGVFTV